MMNKFIPLCYLIIAFYATSCAGMQTSKQEVTPPVETPITSSPAEIKTPTPHEIGDPALYYNYLMAQIYLSQGDIENALAHYRAASSLDPESTVLMFDLANLYVRAGQLEESKYECLKIIKKDPDHFHARLLLAGIYSALGNKEAAITEYKTILKQDPDYEEVYIYLNFIVKNWC